MHSIQNAIITFKQASKHIKNYLESSLANSNRATTPLPLESGPLASFYKSVKSFPHNTTAKMNYIFKSIDKVFYLRIVLWEQNKPTLNL